MIKIVNSIGLIFLVTVYSFAGDKNRRYTNSFLEIPLGARASSLGGAYTSVANDGTSFYWNPAGVALVPRREVSLAYVNQFGGMAQYDFIGYNHELSRDYFFSISYIRYSIDNIPENSVLGGSSSDRGETDYDFSKYQHGHFSYADQAIYFSFARMNRLRLNLGWAYSEFPMQIPVGINLKIIRGGTSGLSGANGVITSNAQKSGVGIDIGTMIIFGMNDLLENPALGDFALGFNLQDATTTGVKYNKLSSPVSAQDVVPRNLKFGVSYTQGLSSFGTNILFSYESNSRYAGDRHYGLELEYAKTASLRMGIDNGRATYGAGINYVQLQLDYALNPHALGATHRLSLSYSF